MITGSRWQRDDKSGSEGQAIGKALADARHVVVIGSPGLGKSALIRFLARTCAIGSEVMQGHLGWAQDLIPVVIPLAGFADTRSRQPHLTLRAFLDEQMTERGGESLRVAMAGELNAGRAFVLLDGVDEIPDLA